MTIPSLSCDGVDTKKMLMVEDGRQRRLFKSVEGAFRGFAEANETAPNYLKDNNLLYFLG